MTDETDNEEQPSDSEQDDSAGKRADGMQRDDAAGEPGDESDVAEDDLKRGADDNGETGWTEGDGSDEELGRAEGDGSDEELGRAEGERGDVFPASPDDATAGTPEPGEEPMLPDQNTDEDAAVADEDIDEAFEDMAVDNVEADEVWADVAEEKQTPAETDEPAPEDTAVEPEVAEVSKRDYCESCEYFSEAPEIRCTHDGTEILEFVDVEHVRLSNCPIVAERQGLEQGVSKGSTDLGDIQRD